MDIEITAKADKPRQIIHPIWMIARGFILAATVVFFNFTFGYGSVSGLQNISFANLFLQPQFLLMQLILIIMNTFLPFGAVNHIWGGIRELKSAPKRIRLAEKNVVFEYPGTTKTIVNANIKRILVGAKSKGLIIFQNYWSIYFIETEGPLENYDEIYLWAKEKGINIVDTVKPLTMLAYRFFLAGAFIGLLVQISFVVYFRNSIWNSM